MYGIDFCCGGKKTLQKACEEFNLDVAAIEAEWITADKRRQRFGTNDFNSWQPHLLAD